MGQWAVLALRGVIATALVGSLVVQLVMVPLLAGILFLGVYPKPALERIEPSVDALLEHVAEFTGDPQPEVSTEGFETIEEQVHELELQEAEHGAEEGGH